MTRLIFVSILVAILPLSVFASGQADSGKTGGEAVQISFTARGDVEDQKMHQEIIAAFEAANPAIKVKFMPYPGNSWDKINAMLAAGNAPDVARLNDDDVYMLGKNDRTLQLDELIDSNLDRSKYPKVTWEILAVEGKQFSVHPCFGTRGILYNGNLFRENGLALPPNDWDNAWSYDKFKEVIAKISKDTNNDGQNDVFGMASRINILRALIWGNGGRAFNKDITKFVMDTPAIREIIGDWRKFIIEDRYLPYMEEDPRLLFNAGKVAMMWDNYSRVFNIPKEIDVDFAPMWKSKKQAMTANAVRVLGIPKTSKHPKEAFALLKFYMDPEGQKLVNKHQWGVPALRTVADNDYMKQATPPNNWKITAQALDHDATLRREPIFWEWFQLSHLDLGVELMNDQITLDQYMSRLTDAMNKALVKWQAQKK